MKISIDQLKERYEQLDTDKLLNIKVTGDLSEQAMAVLDAELSKRDVSEEDLAAAARIGAAMERERAEYQAAFGRRIRNRLLLVIGVVIFAFAYAGLSRL